jgi:hypothetical protein
MHANTLKKTLATLGMHLTTFLEKKHNSLGKTAVKNM